MLDYFVVFHKGGRIIWKPSDALSLKGSPVNGLVQQVLLQGKAGESVYAYEQYGLKWTYANDLDLVFVAVFQKLYPVLYAERLLERVRDEFSAAVKQSGAHKTGYTTEIDFEKAYLQILTDCERSASEEKRGRPVKFEETEKYQKMTSGTASKDSPKPQQQVDAPIAAATSPTPAPAAAAPIAAAVATDDEPTALTEDLVRQRLQQLALAGKGTRRTAGGSGGGGSGARGGKKKDEKENTTPPARKGKTPTTWGPVKDARELQLNPTDATPSPTTAASPVPASQPGGSDPDDVLLAGGAEAAGDLRDIDSGPEDESGDESSDETASTTATATVAAAGAAPVGGVSRSMRGAAAEKKPQAKKGGLGSGLFSLLRNIAGTRVLTRDDLAEPLAVFREGLMAKNVAAPICEQLCDSVASSLDGKRMETLTVRATVRKALDEALTRILTPRRNIDVLRDASAAKTAGRPYVIVFCGVNGVGKSTSLAKVAFWLLNNGLSVLVAACDTFRSGAVEQLETHVTRLSQHGHPISLFCQGYGREPAVVAQQAVAKAKAENHNVVLVDTAGRMQDNEPLMRALSKLVNVNLPDLVLFVGEALVGNDGVDQLVKFSQALSRFGERTVDGVFLTKFDTVDDKVGAAVSMVQATGAPIVFVGVGQHYTSIRKLNVGAVVKALMR